jgi:hypothetical protein
MNHHRPLTTFLSAIALLGLPRSADAAILIYLPLSTQTARADVVVRGRVSEVSSDWDRERERIYTTFRFTVAAALKGPHAPGESLEVKFPGGGAPDGVRQVYSGMPRVEVGAEYLLFLARTPEGDLVPWGLKQSVMRVERDAAGKPEVVRDLGGVGVVEKHLDGERPFRKKALFEVEDEVRTLVAAGESERVRAGRE